jgi:hypothetical protein
MHPIRDIIVINNRTNRYKIIECCRFSEVEITKIIIFYSRHPDYSLEFPLGVQYDYPRR